MRPNYSLCVSLLAVVSLALADSGLADVINLTAKNFEASVAEEPLLLVRFAVPFCCGTGTPAFEEAETAPNENNIKLAEVDCAEEVELCQRKGIQHYPTLRLYESGAPVDTSSYGGIVSYITKQSLPAVSEVTPTNHEDFTKIDKIVVIAYLPSSDSELAHVFTTAAEVYHDDWVFGLSTDLANAEAADVDPPSIIAYRTFDEPRTEFPLPISDLSVEEISDWIGELSVPAIDSLDDNSVVYFNSGKLLVVLSLDPTSEDHDELMEALRPIAREFKPQVNFVWANVIELGLYQREANLPDIEWPAFVINDYQQRPVYESKEITPELVSLKIQQFLEGEFEPLLSSAFFPETQEDEDETVYVVVGNNFEEAVLDNSNDIFIEFYSTGCDHCERLEPVWNSLGDEFAPFQDKITIAKMEVIENELPPSVPFRLLGFPTLKFKPAGSRDFIDYEGDQSLESLIAFVVEHATNTLEVLEEPFEMVEENIVTEAEDTDVEDILAYEADVAQVLLSASQL